MLGEVVPGFSFMTVRTRVHAPLSCFNTARIKACVATRSYFPLRTCLRMLGEVVHGLSFMTVHTRVHAPFFCFTLFADASFSFGPRLLPFLCMKTVLYFSYATFFANPFLDAIFTDACV